MKKKNIFKVFSLFLCLCFALLSFVGCGGEINGAEGNKEPILLGGSKVLTRPENYDFDAAVGDYSKNYFNIYSANIYRSLFRTYAVVKLDDEAVLYSYLEDTSYADLIEDSAENNVKKLFLYDSMRYTITNVSSAKDSGTQEILSQTITLDTNYAWNWSINALATGVKPYFYNYKPAEDIYGDGKVITFSNIGNEINVRINIAHDDSPWTTWEEYPAATTLPNYSDSYYGKQIEKSGSSGVTDYFTSPHYGNGGDTTAKLNNYFQDALEYAIYLIAIGYNLEDDAQFFDFDISYNNATKLVSDMSVGGWETNKISISDALDRAREKYEKQTNTIGLTEANLEEVSKFILQKVIGEKALEKDHFMVDGKSFSRDYEKIVSNIVTYACEEAPIGMVDGKQVALADAFLTSKITDYKDDYFGIDIMGATGGKKKYSDKNLFKNVDAAEYQSIVLFVRDEDLGKAICDLWVAFEYYEKPEGSTRVMDEQNGITINVGVRYFNKETNSVTEIAQKTINVGYAKNGEIPGGNPLTMICFGDGDDGVDAKFSETPVLSTQFDNNVEDGVINAAENGTPDPELGENKKSLQINGLSKAKEYYSPMPSKSAYGTYAVLNAEKFKNVCDYLEVYFDIVKDKTSASNKCYAFKVGTTCYPAA